MEVAMEEEDAGGAVASMGLSEDAEVPVVSIGRMEEESLDRGIGGWTTLSTELDDFPTKYRTLTFSETLHH